jgi:probable HAF family extracellular repeat protein
MTALSPEYTQALGTSADGSVVVGYVCSPSVCEAFRWTTETGIVRLGFLSEPNGIAWAASADGSVVVGESGWASTLRAFRWKSGVMMDLGALPGTHASRAMAVSADGSVVVGRNWVTARSSVAFIWSATTGLRNLRDVLIDDFGLDLTGWTLFEARGISADGRVIVGNGRDPLGRGQGWIAVLPKLGADCLCEVENINPNQVVLQNVGTGGKGSSATRKMKMIIRAVDAPGATCDPGEFSNPTPVNLKMEDDRGNILVDSAKIVVCEGGTDEFGAPKTINVKRDVFFQSPLNCENGALPPPKPDFSLGTIATTGSARGTADYVEDIKIKCFE